MCNMYRSLFFELNQQFILDDLENSTGVPRRMISRCLQINKNPDEYEHVVDSIAQCVPGSLKHFTDLLQVMLSFDDSNWHCLATDIMVRAVHFMDDGMRAVLFDEMHKLFDQWVLSTNTQPNSPEA